MEAAAPHPWPSVSESALVRGVRQLNSESTADEDPAYFAKNCPSYIIAVRNER